MSPNPNYIRGRNFEYETKARWEEKGYVVIRAAGSKGAWDLVAIHPDRPTTLIQCKLVATSTVQRAIVAKFCANPPHRDSKYYHQCLESRVKGSTRVEQTFA